MLGKSNARGFLDSVRNGVGSVRAALSQLATRKIETELPGAVPPPKPAPDGPRWGPLVLLDKVGEGSFGEVYRAWDTKLEREVALKLMRADEEDPALLQEARMLARVEHANVVTVYGADRHDGRSGIWMNFVEGDTLAELLEERGAFGCAEALLAGIDVCRALAAVHQAGLLHRDIKAQNVMRERGGRIVLMDFGLGHDAAGGSVADFGGTPLYMAPEVLRDARATVRSDLYSAGVLLFHLVTRTFPVEGASLEELRAAHQAGWVKLLRDARADLPGRFVRAVEKAIAAEPSQRYPTAGAMVAALETALGTRRFTPPISRRAFLATAPPLALVAGGAIWYWNHRPGAAVAGGASLLLSAISNVTGDRQLDALTEVLRNQLAQSAHFNLLDSDRVRETLQMMTRPADERPDVGTAREVALRTETPLLVYGTLSPLGAGYGLGLVLERIEGNPRTPKASETKLFEARSKSGLFDAIHQAATWVRQIAGEAEKDISALDTQPEEATTSSWEALDYFTQGQRLHAQMRYQDAIAMYRRSTEIDPGFALAWANLVGDERTLRLVAESFSSYRQAVQALEKRHVTRREELRIRGMYAISTGDYASGEELMHTLTLLYKQDASAHHYRALALRYLGRLLEARDELRIAENLRHARANQTNLTVVALMLGRYGEAASYIKMLAPAPATAWNYEGRLKFLQGDFAGADAAFLAAAKGDDARQRSRAFGARAALLVELGRCREAAQWLESAIATEAANGNPGELAQKRLALARVRLLMGQRDAAREQALEAVRQDSDTIVMERAGRTLARAGFAADARRVRGNMNAPDEGRRSEIACALLDGEIAMAELRIKDAVAEFDRADRLMAPIRGRDSLARALEAAGRNEDALVIWRRIAGRPELIWSESPDRDDPGLWTEGLLRAAELSFRAGSPEEGRTTLQQFLKVREHADADSPESGLARKLLQQAQQ